MVEEQVIQWNGAEDGIQLEGESVLRLVENRKTLGVRLHLRAHELVRPERLSKRQSERIEDGKDPDKGMRHWLVEGFGEAPVCWEENAGDRSLRSLEALARRAGYLDARGQVHLDTLRHQRVRVVYEMELGELWRVDSVIWSVEGSGIALNWICPNSILQPGMPFEVERLELERSRIASRLQSRGYAEFSEAHVSFVADTINRMRGGDSTLGLQVVVRPADGVGGGSATAPHRAMKLGEVRFTQLGDTSSQLIRYSVLNHLVSLQQGELYDRSALEKSYRRMMRIPAISRVEMPTSSWVDSAGVSWVDVDVRISKRKQFGLLTELDFTRTDARYGPLLKASWTDRNVSGRGDRLQWTVSGGISSTRPFSYVEGALVPNSGEWSAEANYSILGIPPLGLHRLKQSNEARSEVALAFRRESRPDYMRRSFAMRYGFEFVENEGRNSLVGIDLLELTYTNIEVEEAFNTWLDNQSNAFLRASFQDYAAPLTRIDWRTGWNASANKAGGFRTTLEWSGQMMRRLGDAVNLPINEEGAYLLAGVPFAQFVRLEQEGRWGSLVDPNHARGQWMARVFFGKAWVGQNLNNLPYDRSFFGGGVNGLRGWATRDVGPGGVVDPSASGVIRGLGDWRLECNVEYREYLTDALILALFADAGNVWMTEASEVGEDAIWSKGRWNTVAFNTGIGLRWDFEFFILRLDTGLRLHDPTQLEGSRWIGQTKTRGAFHIGIGHPF